MEHSGITGTISRSPGSGSIDRALDLLFHLRGQPGPVGVTALGRSLGMPRSSAHRLLSALGRRGLVERDERGRWGLGVGLVALGLGALGREPLVAAARPALEEAAGSLGETFLVTAARAGRIMILDKAEGSRFLRAAPGVGQSVPIHATAVGKLYLAFEPERVHFDRSSLEAFTPRTRTQPGSLEREVAEVREQGWAGNRDEWIPGLSAVAAPVWREGCLLGAIALALPSARLPQLAAEDLPARVLAAAARASARLEGRSG